MPHYRLEPHELYRLTRLVEDLRQGTLQIPTHCPVGRGGVPTCAVRRHPNSDMTLRRSLGQIVLLLRQIRLSGVVEEVAPKEGRQECRGTD